MGARLRSWWQVNKRFIITLVTIAFLIVLIKLILIGYGYDWTGFNGKDKSGKTLYDWLQLLIVPVVLAIGGYLFSLTLNRNERKAADKHNQTEREIAQDNQHEAALQEYIDKMSELLLEKNLRESQPEDEVRNIAHVRTLTVLPRLDGMRKGNVLQFLYESKLIMRDEPIVNLKGAYLSEAFLFGANLSDAFLVGVNFSRADLANVDLSEANLNEANLSDAFLVGVNFSRADLCYADLREASLDGAVFSGANLTGAILSNASLETAFMYEADLTGANLYGANLRDAWLEEANLSEANINVEELKKQAKSLKGATIPDGSIHP